MAEESSDIASESTNGLPEVVDDVVRPIETWLDFYADSENLVHLTRDGLEMPGFMATVTELITTNKHVQDIPTVAALGFDERLVRMRQKEALAMVEMSAEFPTLHAHTILGLWGALECFVTDLAVGMLIHEPALLEDDRLLKIRVPVRALANDPRRAMETVVEEISRQSAADLSRGIARFERMLAPVGLGGDVPASVRNAVYAAQQVRNVWAHRGGIADRRFIEACPHLGFDEGERVAIGHALFWYLMSGLRMYGWVIIGRVFLRLGREPLDIDGLATFPSKPPRRAPKDG